MSIKDSGNRHQFESGAVRDMQEGKGRCDLMPLDVVSECYNRYFPEDHAGRVFAELHLFTQTGEVDHLIEALAKPDPYPTWSTMLLEVAIHYEEGAKKYGEYNWQKGLPVKSFINSAVRHYLKWLRGDQDEPHDRAFCWNIMCAIWTCKHKPELNPYGRKKCVVCGADILAIEDTCPKCKVYTRPPENTCVSCGAVIPEGRQVCPNCEELPGQLNLSDRKENNHAED